MINGIKLVGRLKNDIEIKKNTDGEKYTTIVLAVPRTTPEKDGSYKMDLVDVKVIGDFVKKIEEYCKKEDIIGITGYITTKEPEKEHSQLEIIASKVSFLSSHQDN